MTPSFGSGADRSVSRRNERDWAPLPVLTVSEGALAYRQRTFVAPFGKKIINSNFIYCIGNYFAFG